jgi:hypothetical protein
MPPTGHALLSASSAERWLHCPPSARLCEAHPDKGSDYAAEGTDAHSLCEYHLKQALGLQAESPVEDLTWYNAEMENCAAEYAAYVMELLETAKKTCADPVVLIEQRVNFSRWVQDGFGTADCILIADGTLNIVDFKYGKGVEVSAENNPQMKLYALGAIEIFDAIYDIRTVRMTIFQPRKANVSVYELTRDALLEWAETELKPKAQLAYEGKGELSSGDWCRFCKVKAECRKRADANLELARYDFEAAELLDDAEIADVLGKVDALTAWASDVKEFALQQAINGKSWPGWKLVEGRANRRYADEAAVAQIVSGTGHDPYEHKLLGITAMEKLLGKKQFATLLSDLVERPQGKPVLVPASDKRPELKNAKNDFANE